MRLLQRRANETIIGQHLAKAQLCKKLSQVNEKIIVFYMIGGPGTGKTLLAQLLEEAFRYKVYHVDIHECDLQVTSSIGLIILDTQINQRDVLQKCSYRLLNKIKAQF